MSGRDPVKRSVLVAAVVALAVAVGATAVIFLVATGGMRMGMDAPGVKLPPPVKGFADGEEIWFQHTEASHPEAAEMLTQMMGSPVLVVPELALVPDETVAPVYVFTNGVAGSGPLGFQPDVFDRLPSQKGYTPLRRVHRVTWREPA